MMEGQKISLRPSRQLLHRAANNSGRGCPTFGSLLPLKGTSGDKPVTPSRQQQRLTRLMTNQERFDGTSPSFPSRGGLLV